MEWSTACRDWEIRIVNRQSLIPFDPLFPDEAGRALGVFKSLRMIDVAGRPTFGEACDKWVFDFVAAVFGAYDAETGTRHIHEFFMLISKKNGKSTLSAAIMLTALLLNWRHSAELLILAPTIEAAQNSFKPAADMVRADPELTEILHVQDHIKTITHLSTKATLKVVAADTSTVVGKKAGFVLIDELWEFGTKPNAEAMFQEATGGLISRPEGFVISISTQSDKPPAGVFKSKLEYFRKVRDGEINDPSRLPVIYEFPRRMIDDESYLEPENFYVTNPNLGRSVGRQWIEDQLRIKRDEGGDTLFTFLAKHLNVQIGQNIGSDAWAGASHWAKQGDRALTLQRIIDECDVIVAGADGGGLDDLLSLSFLGRHAETRRWMHWQHTWAHTDVFERRKSEASKLRDFEKDGDLTVVTDLTTAFYDLANRVFDVYETGKLAHFGIDPAGVGLIIDAMADKGLPTELPFLDAVSQGWRLQGAVKTAEVKVASGDLVHCAQPIMAWAVGNAKTEMRGNALLITKQASGVAKIDPLMSMFDAVALMSKNPEPPHPRSVYEDRGLLIL